MSCLREKRSSAHYVIQALKRRGVMGGSWPPLRKIYYCSQRICACADHLTRAVIPPLYVAASMLLATFMGNEADPPCSTKDSAAKRPQAQCTSIFQLHQQVCVGTNRSRNEHCLIHDWHHRISCTGHVSSVSTSPEASAATSQSDPSS